MAKTTKKEVQVSLETVLWKQDTFFILGFI